MRFRYTDAQLQYLKRAYVKWPPREMVEHFNRRFGTQATASQLRAVCKNHGFKSGRKPGTGAKSRYLLVTPAQADYLREAYQELPLPELVEAFNRRYNTSLKKSQIRGFLKNHGITCGRTGHYGTPSRPSWNAGTKGLMKANRGSFSKGNVPANVNPLWSERITKEGYVEMKVPERNPHTGHPTRYRLKHLWNWEQVHGPVPEHCALLFLDGDRENCELDNLEMITRAELLALTRLGYRDAAPELRPSIRALAKLETDAINAGRGTEEPMMDQVLAVISERPCTYHQIAARTGITARTACSMVSMLHRRGKLRKLGRERAHTGYFCTLWAADNTDTHGAASARR